MKYKAPCPGCGQPISIWKIMLSYSVLYFKCSKCNTKIRVKGWTLPSLMIAMMIVGYLGILLFWVGYIVQSKPGLPAFAASLVVVPMLIWAIICEIIAILLIINKGTLIVAELRHDVWFF